MSKTPNRRLQDESVAMLRAAPWVFPAREAESLRDKPVGFRAMPSRNPAFIYKKRNEALAQV